MDVVIDHDKMLRSKRYTVFTPIVIIIHDIVRNVILYTKHMNCVELTAVFNAPHTHMHDILYMYT